MNQSIGWQTIIYGLDLSISISFNSFKDRASRKNSTSPEKDTPKTDTKGSETVGAETEATNFIAEIKNAAHQAQNDTGFIYEPTSGLYYDSRTGYYYNAVG